MAINFIRDISEDNFLYSHNNNIVEYYTDNTVDAIIRSDIIINGVTVINVYPSPTLGFFYNLKNVITDLINKTNYSDDLQTDLSTSYTYDWQKGMYLSAEVEIRIVFDTFLFDTVTRDLKFILSAVNQRDYNKRFPYDSGLDKTLLSLPLLTANNNKYYSRYWQGYPFDIGVYKGIDSIDEILVDNLTNGLNYSFALASPKGFERLVFSDGNTSTTIENSLPFLVGFNELKIDTGITDAFLQLEVEKGCPNGVYIKWLNDRGGYSYWLFKSTNTQRNYTDLGSLIDDNNNLEDTVSPVISLGKASRDSVNVTDELLREEQKNLISTMIDSPKVYLFTGTPFSQNNFNDWIEVKVNTSDFAIKNVRSKLYNININFTLPANNNIIV